MDDRTRAEEEIRKAEHHEALKQTLLRLLDDPQIQRKIVSLLRNRPWPPAWCLGHDPSAQILCVSYAQALADKLARDCRGIMTSPWYRRIFPTRLTQHRWRCMQRPITVPSSTLSAANRVVVPCRL
jgi:hypothetical protein